METPIHPLRQPLQQQLPKPFRTIQEASLGPTGVPIGAAMIVIEVVVLGMILPSFPHMITISRALVVGLLKTTSGLVAVEAMDTHNPFIDCLEEVKEAAAATCMGVEAMGVNILIVEAGLEAKACTMMNTKIDDTENVIETETVIATVTEIEIEEVDTMITTRERVAALCPQPMTDMGNHILIVLEEEWSLQKAVDQAPKDARPVAIAAVEA